MSDETETRPSESDMISKPRAKAMAISVALMQDAHERLQNEKAALLTEIARLMELFADIEIVATDPGFESDAMGWIAGYCWKARTTECTKCQGTGQARHIRGHLADCDRCGGRGRA